MTKEMEKKYVPWTWIVSIFGSVIGALFILLSGYILNDMNNKVTKLQDTKVDRSEYNYLCQNVQKLDLKLDELKMIMIERKK